MNDELIGPFPVAIRLGFTTQTIINWAKRGLLPAVFVGRHVRFDPQEIDDFIRSGGVQSPRELQRELNRKPATAPSRQDELRIVRHASREHSAGAGRPDRTRPASDFGLASLVKPDPGLRSAPGQTSLR